MTGIFELLRPMAACIALALDSHAAWAQPYPTKPLTLVVPAAPGGIIDASARLVGDPLARLLGKTVVIDNKAGGSANVGYALVAHAPANGHMLLASYSGYHIGNPALTPKLPWSLQDLTPVALLTVATNVITVHPFLPVSNLQDLIAYLKKHPSQLSYASQGNGSVSHIGTEMFKARTGTDWAAQEHNAALLALVAQAAVTGGISVHEFTRPGGWLERAQRVLAVQVAA